MEAVSSDIDLQSIVQPIMRTYQDRIYAYLESKPKGTLTEADVIIMIMNVSVGISINVYYTLKQILPDAVIDFNFMKAKMINALADGFEKIVDYTPEKTMAVLTPEQIKEIIDSGFTILKLDDGGERKITFDDIMVTKDDADRLLNEAKEKAKDLATAPKLITPPDKKIFQKPAKS